jgi:putative secretion ATPase (PEP-CTERM system associated)
MYEKHFSFKCKPFELVPNTDFLFLSSTHKKAITYLDYGIKEKIGFILLTGEIGAGKTTIVRNLIKNLNGSVKLSKINNTKVSSEQLISMINEDFGLDVEGKNKIKLLSELNEFLIDNYSKRTQPILLIDEAQNLSVDLLEEIRLLSNLETEKVKLLQMILVGQPELKKTLMLPEMTQLRQRININYHIAPLTVDETARYIRHRLTIAGNPDVMKFKGDMLKRVYQFSRGIPRLINILCDFALLTAYGEGKKEIDDEILREISKDLESHDYWDKARDEDTSGTVNKNGDSNLLKTAGDIALRLVKLEETVNNHLKEIELVNEKVKGIEEGVLKVTENSDENRFSSLPENLEEKLAARILMRVAGDSKINELLERVAKLESKSIVVNDKRTSTGREMDDDKPLVEQVELLKKMLNNVNDKLKKL